MKPNESCLNAPLHGKTHNAVLMQSSTTSGTAQAEPIAIGNNVSNHRHVDYQYQPTSPASDSLDLISYQDLLNAKMEDSSGALNSHNLIGDLNELLRRDPTLSSLEEKLTHVTETTDVSSVNAVNQRQSGLDVSGNKTGQASEFSATNPLYDPLFLKADGTSDFLSEVMRDPSAGGNLTSGSHFDGSGIGIGASSFGSGSPSYGMDMSRARQQTPINVNQMTLTQLNSLAENDIFPSTNPTAPNSGIKMEVNYFDDLDALFTTNSSPNVTLGLPPPQQEVKQELSTSSPVYIKEEPQGVRTPLTTLANTNFWRANTDETLFGACHGPSSAMQPNSSSYTLLSSSVGPTRHSTLHRLLIQRKGEGNASVAAAAAAAGVTGRPSPVRSPEGRKTLDQMRTSLSVSNPLVGQQLLSRSAPNAVPMPHMASGLGEPIRNMWARREPRQHMNSVCSVGEASSIADEVNDVLTSLSPSDDLGDIASDDEEDGQNYFLDDKDSSDDDSDIAGSCPSLAKLSTSAGSSGGGGGGGSKKQERYFWQYNVQAKGPKGQKILIETKIEDPHVLNDIVDPVFSGDVKLQGIKHSGKARRGDGNDLTSNPRKLAAIGKELEQLNRVINDMTPVSEMPFGVRCKSRKDKNKLASRACRLKKKAQHEANKVKCIGLHEEHRLLGEAIHNVKVLLAKKVSVNCVTPQTEITKELDKIVEKSLAINVAGNTTNFVNDTIAKNLPFV